MKKNFSRLRRLSRTKMIIGAFIFVVLFSGAAWGVYTWQGFVVSNRTLAEINHSIDRQVADQVLGQSPSEKDIADTPQQSTGNPDSTEASRSHTNSSPSSQSPGTAPSSNTTQKTVPSAESPTSPTYPNDNGDTPQVTLTNPSAWKQTVSGSFMATATASDSSGINRVVFMLRRIGQAMPVQMVTDTEFPYSAIIDVSGLPNGDSDYTIEAQAFDNTAKGNMASYRINIQN